MPDLRRRACVEPGLTRRKPALHGLRRNIQNSGLRRTDGWGIRGGDGLCAPGPAV